jgi:selenocysteine lyase/cysteine desulfurase
MIGMAKEVGALTFIDAVQYAPHGPIDVQELGCDFLVCSPYKFFGPHMGILYGKYDLLEDLTAYKVRPAPKHSPEKWQTGTASFEGICGVHGALEHIEWVGETFGDEQKPRYEEKFNGRALRLKAGMAAIRAYEFEISRAMLDTLNSVPALRIYGPADVRQIDMRVPTFAINLEGWHPRALAEELDKHNIYVWDGNYYALAVTEDWASALQHSGGSGKVGRSVEKAGGVGLSPLVSYSKKFQKNALNDKRQGEGGTLTFVIIIIPYYEILSRDSEKKCRRALTFLAAKN